MTTCQVKGCDRKADFNLYQGNFSHPVCNFHGHLYQREENKGTFIVWKQSRKPTRQ